MAGKSPLQQLQDAIVSTVKGVVTDPVGTARGTVALGRATATGVAEQVARTVKDLASGSTTSAPGPARPAGDPMPPPARESAPEPATEADPTPAEPAVPTPASTPTPADVAKKTTPAKKAPAKKAPAKKSAAKKVASTPSAKLPPPPPLED